MARLLLLLLPLLPASLPASPIPDKSRALLLAVPEDWTSRHTSLQLYRRDSASTPWFAKNSPIPVNLGRRGLAWGRGLHPAQAGLQKREGDDKSPAGIFLLGSMLYGYADRSPIPGWRYRQVTDRDLWIEEPSSSLYNRHLILSAHEPFPAITDVGTILTGEITGIKTEMAEEKARQLAAQKAAAQAAKSKELMQRAQNLVARPGGGDEAIASPTFKDPFMTSGAPAAKFEGPLEQFLKTVKEGTYTPAQTPTGQPMQQTQQAQG